MHELENEIWNVKCRMIRRLALHVCVCLFRRGSLLGDPCDLFRSTRLLGDRGVGVGAMFK